jgi:hypothetical protein
MSDPFDLGGLFGDFFGRGAVPPESVARKILGIDGDLPLNEAGLKAAFRWRLKVLRPDLSDEAADRLRLKDITDEELPMFDAGAAVRFDVGSKQEQLAELIWAREDLLGRIPRPSNDSAGDLGAVRPAPPPALVTADECRSWVGRGNRNAHVFAEVENALLQWKQDAIDHPDWWRSKEWRKHSEDKHFTELAINARLICATCRKLLGDPVYLFRVAGSNGSIFVDLHEHLVGGDNLRAVCQACWAEHSSEKVFPWFGGDPRTCGCGTGIVCTAERFRTIGWFDAERAQSCSPLCARERRNAIAREGRLAARENRSCEVCGDPFTPARADGRYCSSACRQDAYRKRKLGAR